MRHVHFTVSSPVCRARCAVISLAVVAGVVTSASAQVRPAFSGAEGYGGVASANGFANATLYRVTNLDDSGPGSLRGAFQENSANKIIVFDVAGTIQLNSTLDIKNLSNYYIAGQSAPGPVTIYGATTQINASNNRTNSDIVLRYLSFRGSNSGNDTLTFINGNTSAPSNNMIVDHVSASWSEDEILSVSNANTKVTIQNSIISDALGNGHNFGSLIRPRVDSQVTIHHNLYANNRSRQPRLGTYFEHLLEADVRNNVVYNWSQWATYTGGSSEPAREFVDVNYVRNYLIAGPVTPTTWASTAFVVDKNTSTRAYQSENFIDADRQVNPDGRPNGADTGWDMFEELTGGDKDGTLEQMATPFDMPSVTTQSAIAAYWQIINHAGNWWWDRDAIDTRVVNNVMTNTGVVVDSPNDAEDTGLLNAPMISRPESWDGDEDGMPDWWEDKHGLNPANVNDWRQDFAGDGYTNLEHYLTEVGAFPAPAPIVFTGETNGRYEQITNWRTDDGGITTGSHWQPSRFDLAVIDSGDVTIDSVGQHAGLLVIGAGAESDAHLHIQSGWLRVADGEANGVVIGEHPSAQAALTISGGVLRTPYLGKGDSGQFTLSGGVLHADTIEFDLQNDGGVIAPGDGLGPTHVDVPAPRIGHTHVVGDLTLASGTLHIELASESLFDSLLIDDVATLGGELHVELLDGFAPESGSWEIIAAAELLGEFDSITDGFSVRKQGGSLFLEFGAPKLLTGDYNDDGVVDAADYTLWRDRIGTHDSLANDEIGGEIGPDQFAQWKTNFGATLDGAASAAAGLGSVPIPEPAAAVLLAIAAFTLVGRRPTR